MIVWRTPRLLLAFMLLMAAILAITAHHHYRIFDFVAALAVSPATVFEEARVRPTLGVPAEAHFSVPVRPVYPVVRPLEMAPPIFAQTP